MKRIIIIISIIIIIGLIIYNKIYVDNYNFVLNGSDEITFNIGDTWDDPLYITDNQNIIVNNNINYNQEGNYQVTYTLKIGLFKKTLIRKINIVGINQESDLSLNINGENPYYMMNNHEYKESGFEAIDKDYGNITERVKIIENVDNTTDGTYEIKYEIKNNNGIIKTVIRKVIVYSLNYEGKLRTTDYDTSNEIILNINDINYSYTILPDGKMTENREIVYEVNENNKYSFKIYDKNDDYTLYDIDVNNIDNTPPVGTCTFTLNDKDGVINVNATDNTKIKGYEYKYGSNITELLESNNYIVNTLDSKAYVTIYDIVDNKIEIKCDTIDKSSSTSSKYTLLSYGGRQYWFYVPSGTKTRSKAPLVIYLHGGGIGSIDKVNNYALPKHLKSGKSFPYYAAIPYYPSYNITSTNDYVMKLINYLVEEHNIDPDRIVISGGSNGSDPAYYIAANNKGKFSAMMIIAGHSTISDLSKLTYLSVWFHQGEKDNYNSIARYASKINSLGGNAKITKYKGGHSAPNDAFARSDVTDWIVSQKIKK